METSIQSLGDAIMAVTLSNIDEERDIALAQLRQLVEINEATPGDMPTAPATSTGLGR